MSVTKRHVFVCIQQKPPGIPGCHGTGGMEIWEELRAEVFKAGKEDEILISTSGCLGTCGFGPNVLVYPEGTWYTNVKKEEVAQIVKDHLIDGTVVQRNNATEEVLQGEIKSWHMKHRMMMKQAGRI